MEMGLEQGEERHELKLEEFCAFAHLSQTSPTRNKNQQPVTPPIFHNT